MLRKETPVPPIMPWPLLTSLLGLVFCAWSASGNALLCFSQGCALSQDMSIGGLSLWWIGCAAFGTLTLLSMSGRPWLGMLVAGLCLLLDILLLLLMLITTPCTNCLIVALFFALTYMAFRYTGKGDEVMRRSWLVLFWSVFFIGNCTALFALQVESWPMYGAEKASIRLYFSPSCTSCREAVVALANNPDVAFYPVAEKPEDIQTIAIMLDGLSTGDNMAQALDRALQSAPDAVPNAPSYLLHFRMYCNEAYVWNAGSPVVPFIEYHGLPTFLSKAHVQKEKEREEHRNTTSNAVPELFVHENDTTELEDDATLPIDDTGIAGSCGEGVNQSPCP